MDIGGTQTLSDLAESFFPPLWNLKIAQQTSTIYLALPECALDDTVIISHPYS